VHHGSSCCRFLLRCFRISYKYVSAALSSPRASLLEFLFLGLDAQSFVHSTWSRCPLEAEYVPSSIANRLLVMLRKVTAFAQHEGCFEGEDLPANDRGLTKTCFLPGFQGHIMVPGGPPSTGYHGENYRCVGLVEFREGQ